MPKRTTPDLFLHPVRLRIIQAMVGGKHLTTTHLSQLLADIPNATLYRQIALLTEAGVLDVVEEQRVRGAVERSYRLHDGVDPAKDGLSYQQVSLWLTNRELRELSGEISAIISARASNAPEGKRKKRIVAQIILRD
jgi:DNA-binding transcriptional ArsR family regulator